MSVTLSAADQKSVCDERTN